MVKTCSSYFIIYTIFIIIIPVAYSCELFKRFIKLDSVLNFGELIKFLLFPSMNNKLIKINCITNFNISCANKMLLSINYYFLALFRLFENKNIEYKFY